MGRKLRQGDPWMPGYRYGALLPPLSLNLIVSSGRAVGFYQAVFDASALLRHRLRGGARR
jgi:hypothetical protein